MTITITVTGNATRDPELRYTPTGVPVINFGIAVNKRRKDTDGTWVDDGADFYNVTAWRDLATNTAETIEKGMRVLVTGRLEQRQYETSEGEKRTSIEITADELGPSLRWATADVVKVQRSDSSISGNAPASRTQDYSGEEPF